MSESTNQDVFKVRDCALITKMAGLHAAMNLRELYYLIKVCSKESLFHHFCELPIRATFDNPEFKNDFALWSYHNLRDRIIAERLGIINPYAFQNMDELREYVLDLLVERVSELSYIPSVPIGEEFRFMEAATWVFDTHVRLHSPEELIEALPSFSDSTIYYHFVESRRRTDDQKDDFSLWLKDKGPLAEELCQRYATVDFYALNLREIKTRLVQTSEDALALQAKGS